MIRSLWDSLWPNTVAPSVWTLLAVIVSHVRATGQRRRNHEDMKKHVTAATGGSAGEDHAGT